MLEEIGQLNPAEEASRKALESIHSCIQNGESFILEAGAGAGKTYSLIKTLQFLIHRDNRKFAAMKQKIACITFTNVAKNEIIARTDRNPVVYCETVHAFSWSIISGFQKHLFEYLSANPKWSTRFDDAGIKNPIVVEYSLGYPSIIDNIVNIHHDDVMELFAKFVESEKFCKILSAKFPIILIDEYQDTNKTWVDAITTHVLGKNYSPLFGFFGDHWQKIYGDGCGKIDHPSLKSIGKQANFRSVSNIVDCLNRMRPELPQFVVDPTDRGEIHIFHTNSWNGVRQTGNHWSGDLPHEIAHNLLHLLISRLIQSGWNTTHTSLKILMLTHRVLGNEQGYSSLVGIFQRNEQFVRKENDLIAFFADKLEPACALFQRAKYGEMFNLLGINRVIIRERGDKNKWKSSMDILMGLRGDGKVGDIINHLLSTGFPPLPESIIKLEDDLRNTGLSDIESFPRLVELSKLHNINYQEIISLTNYLNGFSPFETKHGVKGAEFENVLVVVGRGWNIYNFNEMLELANDITTIPHDRVDAFERNRNLFYVVCSRPRRRLAILFTQLLSDRALNTLQDWFGVDTIEDITINR